MDRDRPADARGNVRNGILSDIRRAVARSGSDDDACARIGERLDRHARGLIPARGQLPLSRRIDLFVRMATEAAATVERLASLDAVPEAVARYASAHNLPATVRLASSVDRPAAPWDRHPTLTTAHGRAEATDLISVTGCLAGVAETGTIVTVSGPDHPTTLNFLPDNHIVLLPAGRIVGCYEDAWDLLRDQAGVREQGLPRTVNFITGPSRTGDIEQTILMGAHGPRRLHILVIGDGRVDDPPPSGEFRAQP